MVMKDYAAEAEVVRKEKARREKLREDNINDAVGALLGAKNGRDFLWWLLGVAGVGLQPFNPDPLRMAFACGELNVGQQLLDRILSVNPEGYLRMQQEKQDEHTQSELAAAQRAADAASERDTDSE